MKKRTNRSAQELRNAIRDQKPTSQQHDAIFAEELEYLLRASPGSGKTWTSCRRFIWRAANWPYPVGGLALLSFTNTAIREFKAATIDVGRGDLLSDPNYVGTFDSFVERYILAPFGHLLTGAKRRPKLFPGPRPGDWKNEKLKAWKNGRGNKKIPIPAWEVIPYPEGTELRFKSSHTFGNQPLAAANKPVHELLSLGFYTHAQRVFWACELLFNKPHIAELLARRFPEIIVDEAQDSNAWLLVLLNSLRDKGARITLVGDPDQCIFEFGMADATSLPNLKEKWALPEMPLSQSFRCNNQIAGAVRNVGGSAHFIGSGEGANEWRRAFLVEEKSKTFSDGVAALRLLTDRAQVNINSAAVVCRAHGQLASLRGKVNYTDLTGKTKALATAAFLRDSRRDYRGAFQTLKRIVRELTGDDPIWERIDADTSAPERMAVELAIWKFVKNSDRLIPISHSVGNAWTTTMRTHVGSLIGEIGLKCDIKLGHHIKATGLSAEQKALPLLEPVDEFPSVRHDTIHQVKGESIDAVLVIGSAKFWNSVMAAVRSGGNTEDRRLAYVAMTRARHLLIVSVPPSHFSRHQQTWVDWGFAVVP